MMLCRQNTNNCLVMIQPALISYSFNAPPQPVLLDATSVRPDVMLLLDTFFTLVVFHHRRLARGGLPEPTRPRQLQAAAGAAAGGRAEYYRGWVSGERFPVDRFPVPRYILCDEGKSQSRFLMAKVNPSGRETGGE